jgi:hypothetical protein
MEVLAQKSLKMELRLKRYRVLKLEGLDCKFTRLDIKHNSKTKGWTAIYTGNMVFGANLAELIRIYDLFFVRKTGEPGSQSSGPAVGLRSMVDLRRRRDKRSLELLPQEAMATESSPRLEKLGEGNTVKLSCGFSGQCGNGGRPAVASPRGQGAWN